MKVDQALIRKRRLQLSWSQELLAEKAGLNLRTVQRLESTGLASLRTRRAVAAALGLEPAALDAEPADTERPRPRRAAPRGSVFAGVYAFSAVLTLGFVILDQLYARSIGGSRASIDLVVIYSEVADFLLQFAVLSGSLGVAAAWSVWPIKKARWLCLVSVFVGVAVPVITSVLIQAIAPALSAAMGENGSGAALRLVIHTASAVLAAQAWTASRGMTPPINPAALPEIVDRAR